MGRLRRERGESLIELVGYVALAGALAAVAGYFVVYANDDKQLTAEEQAYVVAVATQRADAYVRAVATQNASAPPVAPSAAVATQAIIQRPPAAAPPQAPPDAPPPAPVPTARPPAVAPTAPPPPPPVPSAKPPMATCVGYMVGLTAGGVEACNQLVATASLNASIRTCIADILNGTAAVDPGKRTCVFAAMYAGDPYLTDCLLGLSGQSHFGREACRYYYRIN